METTISIRRFQVGEEQALFEIYHSAIHLVASNDYAPDQINAWAPPDLDRGLWASHMRHLNPLVAELAGKAVGYADVQPLGYIDHFFVSGHYPRQGIGTSLMAALHAEAKRLQLQELTANVSITAQPFFAKAGFAIAQSRVVEIRGVAIANALMR